jgi:hypothetical protein
MTALVAQPRKPAPPPRRHGCTALPGGISSSLHDQLFCVSTVSSVCAIKADAADGADCITGLMLTYGRYPDCPRP